MNPLYSSWNNALDYSRYPRGNTAPTVLPQMHYRYRGSTVQSVSSPRYYREILPIPTVITAVTAVLPHSPLPCHSLMHTLRQRSLGLKMWCLSLIQHCFTRGLYLALRKGWHSCFRCYSSGLPFVLIVDRRQHWPHNMLKFGFCCLFC